MFLNVLPKTILMLFAYGSCDKDHARSTAEREKNIPASNMRALYVGSMKMIL